MILIEVSKKFGAFCSNGDAAADYRRAHIDPHVEAVDEVVFDFSGVRNMNSSFVNALIANLVTYSRLPVAKLRFRNCRPNVRLLIESAVELGVSRLESVH